MKLTRVPRISSILSTVFSVGINGMSKIYQEHGKCSRTQENRVTKVEY